MGWPVKEGDYVEIKESFYPEKVGKIGRVLNVRPEADNPYGINIDGSVSHFPREYLSDPIPVEKIVRRLNESLDRIAALESAQELEDSSSLKP